jgi:uncharacterized phage protein (TIGR01671 family)
MRTIKFRGLEANPYCEELRTFLYGTPLFITNEENYILPNFWDYEGLNKFKVLKKTISQFTGLHDKNGKEIYEGDILDSSEKIPMIFEVYFKNGGFRYGTKDRSVDISFSNLSNNWLDRILKRFHVIGNIYENPELISKTSTHEH